MNQQNHLTKPHKNHRQPHFQERPIEISDSRSVQQDEISEGRPQNLAVDNHNTGMTLPQGDPERLASSEQKLIRVDNAIPVAQGDLAAAENEAPATRSGSHNERDTTMDLSTAASADSPEAVVAGKTMPGITTDPELMDSDVSPEAADTVFTGVIPGQHQSAAESAAPNDASSSASGEEPHHTTESAAVSCTPPEGIENAGARKDHEANENVSLASGSTAPGKMTDDHNLPSDQHGHKLAPNTTATIECIEIDAAISQNSTVAKNEQDRDGDRPLADSVKGEAVRPISSIVGQDACNEFQPGGVHGSCIAVTQDVGSKAPSVQTAAQSTASQASEPASPLSVAKMSPQEITLAELRAQKAALLSSLRVQPAIQVFMEENGDDDDGEPTEAEIMAAANKIVKEHIKLLHEYNELKDVGQGLMGLIADQRGARIVEVQDEFGIDAND
ncbi:hypothetical protein E8E12_005014 [Didymella heteroderae]|uniref:Swi5-domain-containing protein n=1 Tax=Didymella heteroderae TaxID=1769908 RepID=A0A9P4WLY1_9PLEO|nr:hypothetical protein E8E12_005014 [Didymella heteroderae]